MSASVVETVFHYACIQPDKPCLIDERQSISYSQYALKIKKIAQIIAGKGIGIGDTVVVEAQQTILYLSIELALHILGAVFVPVERNCAMEKIVETANCCDAKMIISTKQPSSDCAYISYDDLAVLEQTSNEIEEFSFPKASMVSEILFSTGTTGKEKGIVLTHGNDIALAENVMYGVEMAPDNVEMIPSPMNHSHGLRRYYGNMLCGATVVLITGVMNVPRLFDMIDSHGVNSMDLVPTALSVLLRLSKDKFAEYRNRIRYIQFGAAPLMDADKEKICRLLPDTRLYNFYGSTESGCICIYEFNHGHEKKGCIGKPTRNAKIVITDDDKKPIVSSKDRSGVLMSVGSMNMVGYWNDPCETARVLQNGCVYSNDEAYFDEDGDIILLGRKGDVINVGGNKVSPEEIENVGKRHISVADCGCVPVFDELQGNVPKLYVQMADGFVFDAVSLRTWLADSLEPYKVPRYIEQIDKIPRSYNGKLLRRELLKTEPVK